MDNPYGSSLVLNHCLAKNDWPFGFFYLASLWPLMFSKVHNDNQFSKSHNMDINKIFNQGASALASAIKIAGFSKQNGNNKDRENLPLYINCCSQELVGIDTSKTTFRLKHDYSLREMSYFPHMEIDKKYSKSYGVPCSLMCRQIAIIHEYGTDGAPHIRKPRRYFNDLSVAIGSINDKTIYSFCSVFVFPEIFDSGQYSNSCCIGIAFVIHRLFK